jgi:hypothetical protein|tara:strand:- start:73 stop:1431 length:1359 start_codon:yes stop_codon:yes gene_type:complete
LGYNRNKFLLYKIKLEETTVGLLDKIFGKKIVEEKTLVLQLEEIGPWLNKAKNDRKIKAVEYIEPIMEDIEKSRDTAKEIILQIKNHKFSSEVKKKVPKPVLTSKPIYVKAMLDGLISINSRKVSDLSEIIDFRKEILNKMKIIQKTQMGKGRYMTVAFRDEMLKIGSALNRILDLLNSVEEFIKEEKNEINKLEGLISMTNELNNKIKMTLDSEGANTREYITKIRKEHDQLKGNLKDLLDGGDYKELMQTEKRIKDVKKEKAFNQTRIVNLIGPFTRVFRKYKKLIEDQTEQGDIVTLEMYLEDPIKAFLIEEPECKLINSILDKIRILLENKILKLKKRERDRMLYKINNEIRLLKQLRIEMSELIEEEKRLEDLLIHSSVKNDINILKEELNAIENEIKKLENEKMNQIRESHKIREEIDNSSERLISAIEEREGNSVKVELPSSLNY